MKSHRYGHFCLICGVDSGPIRTFLIVFMGGLALSSLMLWIWALATKRLGKEEDFASLALEAEEKQK